jgi:flagellar biosynthesis protein FliQ
MILVVAFTMPWMTEHMVQHGLKIFNEIPRIIPSEEPWTGGI